jgi:hypothetical protein
MYAPAACLDVFTGIKPCFGLGRKLVALPGDVSDIERENDGSRGRKARTGWVVWQPRSGGRNRRGPGRLRRLLPINYPFSLFNMTGRSEGDRDMN